RGWIFRGLGQRLGQQHRGGQRSGEEAHKSHSEHPWADSRPWLLLSIVGRQARKRPGKRIPTRRASARTGRKRQQATTLRPSLTLRIALPAILAMPLQ